MNQTCLSDKKVTTEVFAYSADAAWVSFFLVLSAFNIILTTC